MSATLNDLEPTFILPEGVVSLFAEQDAVQATFPRSERAAHGGHCGSIGVRLVDDQLVDREEAPGALLRSRLRSASWVVCLSIAALLVWQLCFVAQPIHPWMTGAMLIVAVGSLILLTGPRELSEPQLRVIELGLFGVAGAQLVACQTAWMVRSAVADKAVQLISAHDFAVLGFAVLMLCYGMFMPNGWRRTSLMLLPPSIAPIVATMFVRWCDPFIEAAIPATRVLESTIVLAVCLGIAVHGTQLISALRNEARRGRRLGQYRLKRVLDRGGMGEVYLAEHQLLKRPCAIKIIRPHTSGSRLDARRLDPQALIHFEREVCSMARLSHWHNVEIYDYGHTDDGTFYYVMEYLPGLNLAELVRQSGPLLPSRVIHFLEQTCAALAEAHEIGLVHRDLKPANIFAAYRGGEHDVTKLLDFGLVVDDRKPDWLAADVNAMSPFAGSPLYLSPEQAKGDQQIDPRSDLYSLGAVGYFLLTGQPPFERPSLLRLILAHARDPVAPPSSWRTGIPADLEHVLLRCLEKDPARRYASAVELRHALWRCSDAGKWTSENAEAWWRAQEPRTK